MFDRWGLVKDLAHVNIIDPVATVALTGHAGAALTSPAVIGPRKMRVVLAHPPDAKTEAAMLFQHGWVLEQRQLAIDALAVAVEKVLQRWPRRNTVSRSSLSLLAQCPIKCMRGGLYALATRRSATCCGISSMAS